MASGPSSRRDSIMRAALEIFGAKGYEGATVEEIRRRAGASTGSMYHHFAGKEDLARALRREAVERYQAIVTTALRSADGPEAGVRAVVRAELEWAERDAERARFLVAALPSAVRHAVASELEPANRRYFDDLASWYATHADRGELIALDRETALAVWIGPSQSFLRDWLTDPHGAGPRPSDVADRLADAAWRSLRAC